MLIKRDNKKRSLGNFFKKLFFWMLFLTFFGVSGWVLFFSNYTELQDVKIITDKLEKQPLKDISDNYRAEFWFKYGSKNNFFLFPRKAFTRTLKDQFKTIREVNFKNEFPNTLVVEIEERQDMVVWCSREQYFLLDETGTIFYQLQGNEKEERFKDYNIIFDNSNFEVAVEQKIEEKQLVNFVSELKKMLKNEIGLETERELETPSLISKEIRIKTAQGWQIYFNIENEISTQVELLKEILKDSISQEERDSLNYIDLRISGKAIYNSSIKKETEDIQSKDNKSEEDSSESDDE